MTVNGTAADVIQATAGNGVQVTGLAARVNLHERAVNDRLVVNGLGATSLSGAPGLAALVRLTIDRGDNTLNGGSSADTLIGGDSSATPSAATNRRPLH